MYILHTKSACPTVHGIDNAQLNSGIVAALCLDCLAKQPELGFSKMLEQITSLVVLLEPTWLLNCDLQNDQMAALACHL